MSKASHTLKIPLRLEAWEIKQIDKRLLAHGQLYNAVLHELQKRITTYHKDPISRLPNTVENLQKKYALQGALKISKYATINITTACIQASNNHYLDGKTSQETGLRAWDAIQDYLKTRKGKPETLNPYHTHTVYGMGSKQNLRLAHRKPSSTKRKSELCSQALSLSNPCVLSQQVTDIQDLFIVWGSRKKPTLQLLVNWNHMTRPRRTYFLENLSFLKQIGITRNLIRGEWKYYLLVNLAAPSYRGEEFKLTGASIGLDTGPWQSHGHDSKGETTTFTPAREEIASFSKTEAKIARLQRKMDKSRRANYPENYNDDGTIKKGAKFDRKKRSNNAKQIGKDLAEASRKRTSQKLNAARKTVKEVTRKYDTVIVEDCNYKSWQKRYGKAMHLHTPGLFHSLLAVELKRHEKELIILPLKYAFSQTCICGTKKKKPLSQRVHSCSNKDCMLYGRNFHRDGFSALLMRLVHEYDLTPKELHAGVLHDKFKFTAPPSGIATIEVFDPVVSNQPAVMVSSGSLNHNTGELPLDDIVLLMKQPLNEQIALAETIARRVFEGVTDLTGTPYIEHVRRVAEGVPRWAQAAAWLHDVIEDTDTTAEDLLAEGISQDTVDAVILLTRVSGDGRTYMQYVQALADADGLPGDIARAVKQSDLHDNLGRPTPPEMEGIDRRYKRALVIVEAGIAAHA